MFFQLLCITMPGGEEEEAEQLNSLLPSCSGIIPTFNTLLVPGVGMRDAVPEG